MANAINSHKELNEQEKTIVEFLKNARIEYSAQYQGETKKTQGKEVEWECDNWLVVFQKDSNNCAFDYHTGLGYREKRLSDAIPPKCGKNTVAYKVWEQNNIVPVFPNPASVLYCLLSDATANDESFNGWCSNCGYDNDSMKAFNTYQKCCETGDKLREVFTGQQLQEMRDILQDY